MKLSCHYDLKGSTLVFISCVCKAKLLKRYSVAVNLYLLTSCVLFYPFQFGFFPQFGFFFPIWLLSLCYLPKCIYEGDQLLPYCWHQSSVFTLLNFSAVFELILEFLLVLHFLNMLKNLGNKHRRVFFPVPAFSCVLSTPLSIELHLHEQQHVDPVS